MRFFFRSQPNFYIILLLSLRYQFWYVNSCYFQQLKGIPYMQLVGSGTIALLVEYSIKLLFYRFSYRLLQRISGSPRYIFHLLRLTLDIA